MTKLLSVLLVSATLSGCATPSQIRDTNDQLDVIHRDLNTINIQLAAIEAKPRPSAPEAVCYLAGEKYSVGSVVAGRACVDVRMVKGSDQLPEYGWRRDFGISAN